jgi:hypothetical protein
MLIVGDVLVSDELIDKCFCCDVTLCKGACCVEGDGGAPVAVDEVADLDTFYPTFRKYMTEAGVAAVEAIGETFVAEGDAFGTPLIPVTKACVFSFEEDGLTKCAIEKSFLQGEIPFRKPLSCYLYPIRANKVGKYIALNYHHWDICKTACEKGRALALPVYKFLKEPLIQAFGEEWYHELEVAIESRSSV